MILENPERAWTRAAPRRSAREEVESRLGPLEDEVETLTGGLASLCFGVGDRVLRVARDPSTLDLEEALASMDWGFFRSPRVMGRGDDWLLLERVAHGPLRAQDGFAAGAALAEIHALGFDTCGALDGAVRVSEPFDDFAEALIGHAASLPLDPPLRERLVRHLQNATQYLGPPCLQHGDFKVSNVHACGDTVLVLDWEYAYAGPALMDVGQLMRWEVPPAFVSAFERSYRAHGGELPEDWLARARALDTVNLAGVLARRKPGGRGEGDLRERLEVRLENP